MGYTIKIGEATIVDFEGYISAGVKDEHHDCAPADGSPTDFTNHRWPSYTAWGDFARAAGLYDLFFDAEEGLMREHPGRYKIEQKHVDAILAAKLESSDTLNAGRLAWLQYWAKWALENCKVPTLYNS